jgi:parvulin-like peptidyl-prolyl isomerase
MTEKRGKLLDAKTLLVSSLALVLFSILVILILFTGGRTLSHNSSSLQDADTMHRELAAKLTSVGVHGEAIKAYEDYFNTATLDKRTRSNIAYTVGKLYMETGSYERALSWLYRVDMIDPATPLKREVNAKVVHCLETLGKFHAAEYALDARSALTEKEAQEQTGSKVVAEIGSRKITLQEINDAIGELPPWIQEQLKAKEKRLEFMKKYVADELFYRKAQKLEYDKDADLRKKTAQFMKQQMVKKILEEEIQGKISGEEDDLTNYFKANRDRYNEPAQARIRLIKAGMDEIAHNIVKEIDKGKAFADLAQEFSLDEATAKEGGQWEGWITEGKDDLGIGNVDEVSKAIFSTAPGRIAPLVKAGNYYYIFKVDEKKPERIRDYGEVQEWVKNDYLNNKMQIAYQNLLKQTLASAEVTLYPQAITDEVPSSQ